MMDFQQIYKFPFKLQFPDIGWVYDADDNFIFQFELLMDEDDKEMFISYLNDEEGSKKAKVKFVFENGFIKTESGADVILIRGWGNLPKTHRVCKIV